LINEHLFKNCSDLPESAKHEDDLREELEEEVKVLTKVDSVESFQEDTEDHM
jgi:hypothetical protein